MITSAAVRRHDGKPNERRSCRRTPLQWVVLVFFGQDHWGKLIDLSEKGMCFQFEHPPAPRQTVNFTFEAMGCMAIPHEGRQGKVFGDSIQATGRVIWTRDFERTAGVQFVDLPPRSRDQIRYWISSGATPEATPFGEELNDKWTSAWSKEAVREAAAPLAPASLSPASFAPAEPAAFTDKVPSSHVEELFGNELHHPASDVEVVWKPERCSESPNLNEPLTSEKIWPRVPESSHFFARPALDEPATSHKWPEEAEPERSLTAPSLEEAEDHHRKWPKEPRPADVFEPAKLEQPATSSGKKPGEVELEDRFVPRNLDQPARPRKWPLEPKSEPAPEPQELGSAVAANQSFWERKPVLASQGVEPLGFDLPGMLHHDERHRRGQTLELRQRRARVSYIAVLGFLGTVGALAALIGFTSKFNERAEVTEAASHPSAGKAVSNSAEAGSNSEVMSPFLVEVLEGNNRRSVLLFSSATHSNPPEPPAQNSVLPEPSAVSLRAPREERAPAEEKREPFHDFTLVNPHASNPGTTAGSSLEAPAISSEAPVAPEAALREAFPNPALPAPVEAALPPNSDFQPARLIRAILPTYPQMAKTNRVAGDVTLDALVDASGSVRDVKVISGPLLLREAAKEAVRQWKYVPARLDGRATAMHLTVTVKFQNNKPDDQ